MVVALLNHRTSPLYRKFSQITLALPISGIYGLKVIHYVVLQA